MLTEGKRRHQNDAPSVVAEIGRALEGLEKEEGALPLQFYPGSGRVGALKTDAHVAQLVRAQNS